MFFKTLDKCKLQELKRRFDDGPILLSVGELSQAKGKDVTLKAFHLFLKDHPDSTMLFIGKNGGMYEYLKNFSIRHNVDKRIFFLGYVPLEELPYYYAIADALVHTSYLEGLSTIAMEAMASGLPIVSTPAGGNRELLLKSGAGIIVPFNDPQSTYVALKSILEEKKLKQKLSADGRSYATENFHWDKVVRKYIQVYKGIL